MYGWISLSIHLQIDKYTRALNCNKQKQEKKKCCQPFSWSPCGHPGKPHLKTHKYRLVFSPLPLLLEANRGESKYHNKNCQQEAGATSTRILRSRKMGERRESGEVHKTVD